MTLSYRTLAEILGITSGFDQNVAASHETTAASRVRKLQPATPGIIKRTADRGHPAAPRLRL